MTTPLDPINEPIEGEIVPPEKPVTDQDEDPVDPELVRCLTNVIDTMARSERPVREWSLRTWKRGMEYWRDNQYLFWDDFAHDWKTPEMYYTENPDDKEVDPVLYAKVCNNYKAHGQAIIAALSTSLPYVRFYPDDADNPEDIMTAKAYSKLSELIEKHNDAQLLFVKALFILFNQGVVFAYNDHKADEAFGMRQIPKYDTKTQYSQTAMCPECGTQLGQQMSEQPFGNGVQPFAGRTLPCPNCKQNFEPYVEDNESPFVDLTGYTEQPKTRECIDIYGPLNVEVPHYVTSDAQLKSAPYLRLWTDHHYTEIQGVYPEFKSRIKPSVDNDRNNRYARMNSDYRTGETQDMISVERIWLRPWAYNILPDEDCAILQNAFPKGVYFVRAGAEVLEAVEDNIDDHWTVSIDPTSQFIHADPIGKSYIPIQDMTNELMNLTLETIEFGIPETFADPSVLSFNDYKKSPARPGQIFPAKAPPGQSLQNGFFEIKNSSLSQEVGIFANRLDQMGQFVLGSFPSIWGGAIEGGSGTAREYEMSRTQALQRLSTTWMLLKVWWSHVMGKSVTSFAKNMGEDEKFVKSNGNSFTTIWIKQSEMTGKVGQVEPDVNESFPVAWSQKRDLLLQMIQMQNEDVAKIVMHPENTGFLKETLGVEEVYIPGDDSRNKQLIEIQYLLQAEPAPTGQPGIDGQERFQSTVPVDPLTDDHGVEVQVCLSWLNSDIGVDTKKNNPGAWYNVRSHCLEHMMAQGQQQMMMQMMNPMPAAPPGQEGEQKQLSAGEGEQSQNEVGPVGAKA